MKMSVRLLCAFGLFLATTPTVFANCTATVTCQDGTMVTCSGNNAMSSCSSSGTTGIPYVTCDGTRSYCPQLTCTDTDTPTCNLAVDCYNYCFGDFGLHGACSRGCCRCF